MPLDFIPLQEDTRLKGLYSPNKNDYQNFWGHELESSSRNEKCLCVYGGRSLQK